MNEFPQIPELLPSIPKGWLWTTLAAPPLVTLRGNTIVDYRHSNDHGGALATVIAATVAHRKRAWATRWIFNENCKTQQ